MHEADGGKTIRIILRDCACGRLSDPWFTEAIIQALCSVMGMTPVGEPFTRPVPPGLSCGLVIAESHLFIHTWPETSSARVVIDSCVDFDHNAAAEWIRAAYGAEKYTYAMA